VSGLLAHTAAVDKPSGPAGAAQRDVADGRVKVCAGGLELVLDGRGLEEHLASAIISWLSSRNSEEPMAEPLPPSAAPAASPVLSAAAPRPLRRAASPVRPPAPA